MRLVVGGVHSGVGKTTLAAGRPCRNLDIWMISPDRVAALFHHHSQSIDISIIEGVMGLFDGQNYQEDTGSTAQVAKLTRSPVILILDASAMAQALGFQHFDPELALAGFIVNFVGGQAHGQGVAGAIERATGLPVLGWLPSNPALKIPERHLGLIPTAEDGRWQDFIDSAAEHVSRYVDLDRLLEIARSASAIPALDLFAGQQIHPQFENPSGGIKIAVAHDEAFNFTVVNGETKMSLQSRIQQIQPINELTAQAAGQAGDSRRCAGWYPLVG